MDLIGELLRSSLLTEIGDHEERVARAREAASDLALRFGSDLQYQIPGAIIAAVDEETPHGTGVMQLADDALTARWETFHNAFPEVPTEILRAILLAAVGEAATTNADLRFAGWYTLRSAVESVDASRWESVLTILAAEWDDAASEAIGLSWSPPQASATVRMPSVAKFQEERIGINTKARAEAKRLHDEPTNYQVFSQELQSAYLAQAEAFLSASEVLAAESHRRSVETLRSFATELGGKLRETLAAQEATVSALRIRSDLLWWYQTRFSPSMRLPYSDLEPSDLPIVAALDLHNIMPGLAPLAAEFLLAEVVSSADPPSETNVAALSAAGASAMLPGASGALPANVLEAVRTSSDSPLLRREPSLGPPRAAVLLFRDLQAKRLLHGPVTDSDEGQ